MDNSSHNPQIHRTLVPEYRRVSVTAKLFDYHFATRVEPLVFNMTSHLSKGYAGGYWAFYTLSNGGFYMAPASEETFHVIATNFYQGDMSADALGITACLYAYSHLAFGNMPALAMTCSEQYHLLREFAFDHAEVEAIMQAID